MALRLVEVNFKARDDVALGRFWAEALGWGTSSEGPGVTNVEPVGLVWPDPVAVCVDVVSVPDPETVAYRAHLDLATTSTAHQAELVARLKELGATPADVARVTCRGRSWPTRRATCSASWSLDRSTETPGRSPRWSSTASIRGPRPGDDQAAEVARLRALGATDADVGQGDVPWVCLADVEGNEFCVLTPG